MHLKGRKFIIFIFVTILFYSCNFNPSYNKDKSTIIQIDNSINDDSKVYNHIIQGSIIDLANGYCGIICQGGMLEIKLNTLNNIACEDTFYIITECSNYKRAKKFKAYIRDIDSIDLKNNYLFQNYNKVKRFKNSKSLYKIIKVLK